MTNRQRRMVFVAAIVIGVAAAAALTLRAFQENMLYFVTPSDLLTDPHVADKSLRLGGMVKEGSVQRESGSMEVRFIVTDNTADLPVAYVGVLPDLFREGQGVIARGRIVEGVLRADEVLAKHDENYMPPEVAKRLEAAHGGALPQTDTAATPQY